MPNKPEALIGGVDWISKKWLLESFVQAEKLSWDDPWLQSLDLEYHNIDPRRGLFFGVNQANESANGTTCSPPARSRPPADTRAAVAPGPSPFPEGIPLRDQLGFDRLREPRFSRHGRPFETYVDEVERFLSKPRTISSATEQQL